VAGSIARQTVPDLADSRVTSQARNLSESGRGHILGNLRNYVAVSPLQKNAADQLKPQDYDARAADNDVQRAKGEFPTGRQPRNLELDEIEVFRNRGEILTGLIGLAQCQAFCSLGHAGLLTRTPFEIMSRRFAGVSFLRPGDSNPRLLIHRLIHKIPRALWHLVPVSDEN
jgi:hypothetical protein